MIAALAVPLLLTAAPTQFAAPARPLLALRGGARGVQKPSNKAGTSSVVGGVLLHLACGAAMATAEDTRLALLAQMAGMPLGPLLEKQLGPRLTAVIGSLMMGSGVLLSSFATTLMQFVLSYAVLFGLGKLPALRHHHW